MQMTDALRAKYQTLWDSVEIKPEHQAALTSIAKKLVAYRLHYDTVSVKTGVPWYMIAVIHERESSCDFKTYLGNGDPLNRKSVHVPAGRGPFATWEAGAIDALKLQAFDKVKAWDIPTLLCKLEEYNGLGYRARSLPSPYLWSFTNHYTAGKFTSDGHFSAEAIDSQPGCAALIRTLEAIVPGLLAPVSPQPATTETSMATPAPVVSIPVASSNVVVSPWGSTLLNIIGMAGAFLATSGVDVTSLVTTITHGNFWAGLAVSVGTQVINHLNLQTSNIATIAAVSAASASPAPAAPAPAAAS